MLNGSVATIDLTYEMSSFVSNYATFSPPTYTRLNYNSQRVSQEDFNHGHLKVDPFKVDFDARMATEIPLDYANET